MHVSSICPEVCGVKVSLFAKEGEESECKEAIQRAADLIVKVAKAYQRGDIVISNLYDERNKLMGELGILTRTTTKGASSTLKRPAAAMAAAEKSNDYSTKDCEKNDRPGDPHQERLGEMHTEDCEGEKGDKKTICKGEKGDKETICEGDKGCKKRPATSSAPSSSSDARDLSIFLASAPTFWEEDMLY